MARGDVFFASRNTGSIPTRSFQVTSGAAASITAGEPVLLTTIGTSQYAEQADDGNFVIGTTYCAGIASDDSTDTASAAGAVNAYRPDGIIWRCAAKSAAAADTQSELNALNFKRTVFDLTSSVFTVDASAADGATNGLIIVGGDINGSFIDFIISIRATIYGF